MKRVVLYILSITFLTAIYVINISPESNSHNKYEYLSQKVDTAKNVGKTVLAFLKWYKNNYENIYRIEIVNNMPGTNYDSTKYYSVNFEGTENYLKYMKSSRYISDKYLDYWRAYFKKCDDDFKKNPVNDGPPEGFDLDFVLITQEIDYAFEKIETAKITKEKVKNNKAEVLLTIDKDWAYKYELTYDGKKWLIDSIDYYNPILK
jgi:hypothetical protein